MRELYVTREFIEDAHSAVLQRVWRTVTLLGVPYRIVRKADHPRTYVLQETERVRCDSIGLRYG